MKRLPLITSFVLFIALCVSSAYWAMQLFKPPVRTVVAPPKSAQPAPKLDAAANLFGGRSTAAVASNFQLKGVVVASNAADSVAILAANGRPAHTIRTNEEVVPGVTVKEINHRYVLLSEGGVSKRVDLPEKAKAQMKMGISSDATGASSPPPPISISGPSTPIPGSPDLFSNSPGAPSRPPKQFDKKHGMPNQPQ